MDADLEIKGIGELLGEHVTGAFGERLVPTVLILIKNRTNKPSALPQKLQSACQKGLQEPELLAENTRDVA
jgi:hypothetical protein